MRSTDQRWEDLIPDPVERAAWVAHFRRNILSAETFYPHFTNPERAATWADAEFGAQLSGYLDRHNVPCDADPIWKALDDADDEADEAEDPTYDTSVLRAGLILAHPHLTRADRDATAAAGLTFDEIDHLITTGTYNRATLDVVGALR